MSTKSKAAKPNHAAQRPLAPKSTSEKRHNEDEFYHYLRKQAQRIAAPPPQQSVEELASCHFIANYILLPRGGDLPTRGFLEFVIPLYKAKTPNTHFSSAFEACAIASLNNRVGTGNHFDKMAVARYTNALASTYAALRDPVAAQEDSTLGAVLLLALFENISAKSSGAWASHIEGAIQLTKLRGPGLLKSKIGMDLFMAMRTHMVRSSITCIKAGRLTTACYR